MPEHTDDCDRIGRYQLRSRIGYGAQGVVYEALDPELDRVVAVKSLDPDPEISTDVMETAYGEARAAASLDHPSIATIYDFGVHGTRPYLVFQYVPGIGLEVFLDGRGALAEKDVWEIMQPVLQAMQHAHSVGVAHLDLKPHNIRVTPQGLPKILDFGLARFFACTQTAKGPPIGTPRYMSPEQFKNQKLGPYSDVFALSLMLFEMLVGAPAKDVENALLTDTEPYQCDVNLAPLMACEVSEAAIAVLRDGLAIDVQQRIPDAGALAERLRHAWEPAAERAPLDDRAVKFVIRRLKTRGDLPAFPKVVLDVNRMTAEGSVATIKEIANVVLRDNALSTRLLRLANSAFHTTRVKATRISDAISRLGFEQVRVAANGMGYFSAMTGAKCPLRLREVLLISFASGLVARHFALTLRIEKVEEAMLCGMLFNTGEHLVLHCLPEEHEEICALVGENGDDARLVASREVLGVDYALLGSAVAATWHLPDEIVTSIAMRSPDAPVVAQGDQSLLPRLATAANELCERAATCAPDMAAPVLEGIAHRHRASIGLDAGDLVGVVRSVAMKMHQFAPVLGINPNVSEYMLALAPWMSAADTEPETDSQSEQQPGRADRAADVEL